MKMQAIAIAVLLVCALGVTAGTCYHLGCGNNQGGSSNTHDVWNITHSRYKMCTGSGHYYVTSGLTICSCTWPHRDWACNSPE